MLPLLREQLELSIRQSQSCCIAMIDLDLFKKVNDQYGHLVGDSATASLAKHLIAHLRTYDKIFRYGGEEFLICIPQVNVSQAFEMLERIREEIAAMPFNVGAQKPIIDFMWFDNA